jgi:hypothetical protein
MASERWSTIASDGSKVRFTSPDTSKTQRATNLTDANRYSWSGYICISSLRRWRALNRIYTWRANMTFFQLDY